MSTSAKRPRTQSSSRSSSSSSITTTSPPPKSSRTIPDSEGSTKLTGVVSHPLLCTLPPTCHRRPTPIAHSKDLEAHYAKYHAHVCEEEGCGCVFPDERLLDLHQTECHDTLAAIRKERGEKIFACHLATCPRLFATPKTRRLHLIQAHGYPKEYFFAVTNKGIGGLLKKWGDGASMIRGQWKPRENGVNKDGQQTTVPKDQIRTGSSDDDSDDSDDALEDGDKREEMEIDTKDNYEETTPKASARDPNSLNDADMDKLTNTLSSLSLVPPSVRFGRGGKINGFAHNTIGPQDSQTVASSQAPNGHTNGTRHPEQHQSRGHRGRGHHNSQHQRQTSGAGSESGQGYLPRGRGNGRGRGGRGRGLIVAHNDTNGVNGMEVDKAVSKMSVPVSVAQVTIPIARGRGVIHLGDARGNLRGSGGRGRGRGRGRGS